MLTKLEITGTVEALSGIHIGGSSAFAAIGAVDSPVMKDVYTDYPMIPGSSLKGKMRSLLARQYADGALSVKIEDEDERIRRIFGYTGKGKSEPVHPSRLLFSDLFLINHDELKGMDISDTEVKFENTINRLTAVANPRQIERAVKGTRYGLHLIYNVEAADQVTEDFRVICDGLRLLTYDYIGGHGSRGYGRITFRDLELDCVAGTCADDILEECRKLLKDVG